MGCLDGIFELVVIVFMITYVFYFVKRHQCMKYTPYCLHTHTHTHTHTHIYIYIYIIF
jgi:hypothetical protein